jgi:hypothetical protein
MMMYEKTRPEISTDGSDNTGNPAPSSACRQGSLVPGWPLAGAIGVQGIIGLSA